MNAVCAVDRGTEGLRSHSPVLSGQQPNAVTILRAALTAMLSRQSDQRTRDS